uniref:Heteropteran venom family 5 protein 2 n=1 Tax=Ectomocoris sp. TaxID=3104572 RepID=A0AB38ZE86_9HEMI
MPSRKELVTLLCLLNAVFVFSETKLVNEDIDQKLAKYNAGAKDIGLVTMEIVDLKVNGFKIKRARLGIMHGLRRDGDVYREDSANSITYRGIVSMVPFVIEAGELSYGAYNGPANITADLATADFSFTSSNLVPGDCETHWNKFTILSPMKNVILHMAMGHNEDITDEVNNNFLPKFNQLFKTDELIKVLNERFDFCDLILGISKLF